MAEVRKRENVNEYKIKGQNKKKRQSTNVKGQNVENKKSATDSKNLWVRFRIFCHGVKSEFSKVHWPNKKDMIKYSVATIVFIIFCSLFFYLISVIFAFVQSLS